MCGLWALLLTASNSTACSGFSLEDQGRVAEFFKAFMQVKPRGPENSLFSIQSDKNAILGFHRLAINGLRHISANQPFLYDSADDEGADLSKPSTVTYVMCNGEIYNFRELAEEYNITLKTGSDCEIIYPLYKKLGPAKMMEVIDSESAIIICSIDKGTNCSKTFVSRDVCGIRPLYYASNSEGMVCFSSELKGIPFIYKSQFKSSSTSGSSTEAEEELDAAQHRVQHFPPRTWTEVVVDPSDKEKVSTVKTQDLLTFNTFFDMAKIPVVIKDRDLALKAIREQLIDSVYSRIEHCDREFACLLSGGLDSSLVSAICKEVCDKVGKKLRTYCVAMDANSPDVKYAKMVADHIGSIHETVVIPEQEWLDVIPTIVRTIESFDITTIRASTGQFLISRWIEKNTNIKVLMIGDGSDELTGGYLYLNSAPDADAFHQEVLKLMNNIHLFDVQRSDRGIADNGLEARVPFLRRKFIETYLSIDVSLRMPKPGEQEKQLLRDAFHGTKYLPDEVLYRRKEAFSDGVSTHERSWYQVLQEHIDAKYTDEEFAAKAQKYAFHISPPTKEALFYRELFEEYFGQGSKETAKVLPRYWLPNWQGDTVEPSARVLKAYQQQQQQ